MKYDSLWVMLRETIADELIWLGIKIMPKKYAYGICLAMKIHWEKRISQRATK